MMQPTQLIFQGQWTHKKSRYSSPVDHRSLDDLCISTYTMSQKLCARYLYFERNVAKFGVRVIGRKIQYLLKWYRIWLEMQSFAYRKRHQPECVLLSGTLHSIYIQTDSKKVILFHKKPGCLMCPFLEPQKSKDFAVQTISDAPPVICRSVLRQLFVVGFPEILMLT